MNNHEILMASPPWALFKKHQQHLNELKPPSGEPHNAADMFAMFELGLQQLPSPDHCLFIWAEQACLEDCHQYMADHGYTLHRSYVWMQVREKGNSITFPCTHLEWYYKGNLPQVEPNTKYPERAILGTARSRYSKPDHAYQLIEALYPRHHKIELFGWERRPAWEQWANYRDRLK